ncbi:hypothetical protein EDC94DRAFT_180467 [Helicostylum pulchrum]|nr:hypothetical protein EDC94DRAFT_180467 [Helicostylum pulchrum]
MKLSFLLLTFFISFAFATPILSTQYSFSCYKQVNDGHCLLQGMEKSRCRKSGYGFTNRCEDDGTLCKACNPRNGFFFRAEIITVSEDWCVPQGGFVAEFNISCTDYCDRTPTPVSPLTIT